MPYLRLQPVFSNLPHENDDIQVTSDELRAMWAIVTRAKDAIDHGYRLENLSWRLWYSSQRFAPGFFTNQHQQSPTVSSTVGAFDSTLPLVAVHVGDEPLPNVSPRISSAVRSASGGAKPVSPLTANFESPMKPLTSSSVSSAPTQREQVNPAVQQVVPITKPPKRSASPQHPSMRSFKRVYTSFSHILEEIQGNIDVRPVVTPLRGLTTPSPDLKITGAAAALNNSVSSSLSAGHREANQDPTSSLWPTKVDLKMETEIDISKTENFATESSPISCPRTRGFVPVKVAWSVPHSLEAGANSGTSLLRGPIPPHLAHQEQSVRHLTTSMFAVQKVAAGYVSTDEEEDDILRNDFMQTDEADDEDEYSFYHGTANQDHTTERQPPRTLALTRGRQGGQRTSTSSIGLKRMTATSNFSSLAPISGHFGFAAPSNDVVLQSPAAALIERQQQQKAATTSNERKASFFVSSDSDEILSESDQVNQSRYVLLSNITMTTPLSSTLQQRSLLSDAFGSGSSRLSTDDNATSMAQLSIRQGNVHISKASPKGPTITNDFQTW